MIGSNRWTELQEVAGSAAAVPLLQSIVNSTPDGAVRTIVEGFVGDFGGGRELGMWLGALLLTYGVSTR